jgi:hypothetical protein
MRKLTISLFFLVMYGFVFAQQQQTTIKQMTWGPDYQVYIQLNNDTSYNLQIEELFHANPEDIFNRKTEFYYYPVNFEQSYIDSLLANTDANDEYTVEIQREPKIRKLTLWGVVGPSVGGGWVHFINCLVYALESRRLELTAPLLKRPESTWKPNPMTESFKRTRKWAYYAPVDQKQAQKEYKIRKRKNQLGDLKSIPQSYIDLMLSTNNKEYIALQNKHDYSTLARIDLVKLMLGAPYMSETQIEFINSRVLQSISNYNKRRMPTVLIFDKYQAAVAMTLDGLGYKAEKIVFREQENLSFEEIRQRTIIIRGIIALINEQNGKAFKERLNGIYKPKDKPTSD